LGVPEQKADLLVTGLQNKQILEEELLLIEKHDVIWVTAWCETYPQRLKHIDVPPILVYIKGNSMVLEQDALLGCVGSRVAHRYAQDSIDQVVKPLIEKGWIVVSGGALGADTFAHSLCLEHNMPTVAVVGTGLSLFYPAQNKKMFDMIVQKGGA